MFSLHSPLMIPFLILAAAALSSTYAAATPSFAAADDAFLLNGEPIQIRPQWATTTAPNSST